MQYSEIIPSNNIYKDKEPCLFLNLFYISKVTLAYLLLQHCTYRQLLVYQDHYLLQNHSFSSLFFSLGCIFVLEHTKIRLFILKQVLLLRVDLYQVIKAVPCLHILFLSLLTTLLSAINFIFISTLLMKKVNELEF